MKLTDIDFHGLGHFTNAECGFRVDRYHLEERWRYIYVNEKLLLDLDQRGINYIQFNPPGGTLLAKRERYQEHSSCLVWICTSPGRAFTNFYHPTVDIDSPLSEPDEYWCEYRPECALFHVKTDSITCDTEILVPPDDAVVSMTCKVTNTDNKPRDIRLIPAIRPHLAGAALAPWDVPSMYQTVGYSNESAHLFHMELRNPAGIPERREYAFILSSLSSPDSAEVDYASYVGNGTFENPQAVHGSPMQIDCAKEYLFGNYTPENSVTGIQGIVALSKNLSLKPNESFEFTMLMGSANTDSHGIPPTQYEITFFERYFDSAVRDQAKGKTIDAVRNKIHRRTISTPDEAFNRYVNEWLPLQLDWVITLDRGWPTGMAGTRDSAQDATALIPLNSQAVRKRILSIFGVQRSDGWFPRQYSLSGKHGTHDLRNYVDGGVWVWELLCDYLRFTKDFDLLSEDIGWLDSDRSSPILEHVCSLIDYYLDEKNIGEHGLCLIREGDWNDSINRAGLEGRGESVMVSCQVVMMLRQAAELFNHLSTDGVDLTSLATDFQKRASSLKKSILTHALNSEGYLNGVFTDNGEWVFSPSDPDGQRRVNIPVNAFGIISGVLESDNLTKAIDVLTALKQSYGWPLFFPGIGSPPINKLGRLGQGDLVPGLAENGTPYNHGCHGFFGRAAAVAKRGDLLLEIMKCMLPYDQDRHPIDVTKTAPYGVVNHWKTLPGIEGRGGDIFLSGSISTALRTVYDGIFGIKPTLNGLGLDPVLPTEWPSAEVRFAYRGSIIHLKIQTPGPLTKGLTRLTVNGKDHDKWCQDAVTGHTFPVIPDSVFQPRERYEIVVR